MKLCPNDYVKTWNEIQVYYAQGSNLLGWLAMADFAERMGKRERFRDVKKFGSLGSVWIEHPNQDVFLLLSPATDEEMVSIQIRKVSSPSVILFNITHNPIEAEERVIQLLEEFNFVVQDDAHI